MKTANDTLETTDETSSPQLQTLHPYIRCLRACVFPCCLPLCSIQHLSTQMRWKYIAHTGGFVCICLILNLKYDQLNILTCFLVCSIGICWRKRIFVERQSERLSERKDQKEAEKEEPLSFVRLKPVNPCLCVNVCLRIECLQFMLQILFVF